MRIGFDAKRYFHNKTGLGNFSRTLIDGIKENFSEHEYLLFDTKPPKDIDTDLPIVSKSGLLPFWRQLRISKDINRNQLDIYHGLSAELPYTRPRNTKLVVTIHDLIFLHYPEYYRAIDRFIYKNKTVNALGNADAVIVTSEQTKRDLKPLIVDDEIPIHVIYQDCDAQFYQKQNGESLSKIESKYQLPNDFILMVSKFEKRKNHLTLLQAIKSHSISDIPFVFVGRKGDTYDEVQRFVNENGLDKNVQLFTDVPTNDLPALYQLANISIFPSEYEGFGIPILESLASNTPVLTSQDSCMSEIAGNAGLYFDPLSPDSIANALQEFKDTNTRNKLISSIEGRLKHFDKNKLLQQHITLYQSLIC